LENYPETGCEEFVPHSDILESWVVHSILAPRAFAGVLKRRNLWSLIEFVLQLPLESYKIQRPLPHQRFESFR
jgi:hypothetical protein